MTCALRGWAGLPALCLAALALPTAAAEPLSRDQLRAEVTGNTLTGFNTSGVVFSEFHAPDGRILDAHLANGRFACGDAFTVADITGLVAVDFMKPARIPLPGELSPGGPCHGQVP